MKIDSSHISPTRVAEAKGRHLDAERPKNDVNSNGELKKIPHEAAGHTKESIASTVNAIVAPSHLQLEGGNAPEYIIDLLQYVVDELLPTFSEDDDTLIMAKQLLEEEVEYQKQVINRMDNKLDTDQALIKMGNMEDSYDDE